LRIGKLRRVGDIEGLRADFHPKALAEDKVAADFAIEPESARPTDGIASEVTEAGFERLTEARRIEPWVAKVDPVQDLDGGYQIGRLYASWQVECIAVCGDLEMN